MPKPISRRIELVRLALASRAARRGARRGDHPFMAGFRSGQVIAHQGGHWPDAHPNTMAAFELAAPRTQVLDIDVWATADGVAVCSHDDELASGRRVSASTWAELDADADVPRLADVAAAFPEHRLNIEVKDAAGLGPVRDAIESLDLADRTCLSTFGPLLARALAGAVPAAAHARPTARRVGRIWGSGDIVQTMTFVPDAVPALGRLKPLLLRFVFSAGSPERVQRQIAIAAAKGFPLFAWTVNDATPLRDLLAAGADAVLSDDPALFDAPAG